MHCSILWKNIFEVEFKKTAGDLKILNSMITGR